MLNAAQLNNLTSIRKRLHAHPEVSEQEFETQKTIVEFLNKESDASVKLIAKTGVLAIFNSHETGPTVMIRGDIDALPIMELNSFDYASTTKGVSHKCGHDGHTTILLGLAQLFSERPIEKGKLILLFQPAEENGMGAQAVMSDVEFKVQKIDYVFALHNLPGYKTNEIVVKENEFTGNVKSIILKMTGKTAHAAEPHKGVNPSMAISEIFAYANRITFNKPAEKNFFLMTPVYSLLGDNESYGISAGYGEVHFTIRSWSTDLMKQRSEEMVVFIEETCKNYGLSLEVSWTEVFHANINHPEAVDLIRNAGLDNKLSVTEREYPFPWGEDFGLFTLHYKGAMFGLGAGVATPSLHNPDYDYPDAITETGIRMFSSIINQIL
ncbi:MAG: amidohydrolase [Crocinitomicaceae bacterium]|jgi:amidohydrolase